MTVQNTTKKVTLGGNGVATTFSFSPMVIHEPEGDDDNHLEVTKTDINGTTTTLSEGTGENNYSVTVSAYPGTGSITYPASGTDNILASGESITIRRVVPQEQNTDLENQGGYFPEVLEKALDLMVMMILQVQEEVDRSIKANVAGTGTTVPTGEANKVIGWDANGTNLVNITPNENTFLTTPASATDNALVRYDGTTGEVFQDSKVVVDDDGNITIENLGDDAAAGPTLSLNRNSDSPAAEDSIGTFLFQGENSASEKINYGEIKGKIADPTDASEDGRLAFSIFTGGSNTQVLTIGAGSSITVLDNASTSTSGPKINIRRDSISPANDDLTGEINFNAENDNDEETTYARIGSQIKDVADGAEDGQLLFSNMRGGYLQTGISPGILYDSIDTTSGSSHDFTGIPAEARRITITFRAVSTDGTGSIGVQIGDSGGIENTGYVGAVIGIDDSVQDATVLSSDFAASETITTAGNGINGSMILTKHDANTWCCQSITAEQSSARTHMCGGSKVLSGTLDRLRIQSSDTFDSGSVNILVE